MGDTEVYKVGTVSLPQSSWKLLLLLQAELGTANRSRTMDYAVKDLAKRVLVGEFNAQKQPKEAV